MNKIKTNRLPLAIIFAAIVISGALVFLGFRMNGRLSPEELKEEIFKGIDAYIQEQQDAQREAAEKADQPRYVEGDFTGNGAVLGDKSASVTIVEFSEFQCPYCGKFYAEAYQDIKKNYIDTGKAKIVFRHLPLSFHEGAYPAALASECVRDQGGDEKFFEFHNILFADQSVLSADAETIKTNLAGIAEKVGMNMNEFNECIANDKFKDAINADTADATKATIEGTPGFIINGEIISGAREFSVFEEAIEKALKE